MSDRGRVFTNKVLFVGESENLPPSVVDSLRQWGVPIQTLCSLADALPLVKRIRFRMILTRLRVADGNAAEFIPLVTGQPMDLFSYLPIQEGVLWLPLVLSGKECVSAGPLQTAVFLRHAKKIFKATGNRSGRSPLEIPAENES